MSLLVTRGTQTQYDMIWNFTTIFIFSTLRIFYAKMATSEGGGPHILSWDRANPFRSKLNLKTNWTLENTIKLFYIYREQQIWRLIYFSLLPPDENISERLVFLGSREDN